MRLNTFLAAFCAVTSPWLLPVSAQQIAATAYAPSFSPCPCGTSLIRYTGSAHQTLSRSEEDYVQRRRSEVLPTAWRSYLNNVERSACSNNITLPSYIYSILSSSHKQPILGIAASGGGYRATIFGAGVLTALDGRNSSFVELGTGGLLQAATYLSGLSGGAWLVTSFAQANFPTFPDLIFGSANKSDYAGWLAQIDLMNPSLNPNVTLAYQESLIEEISVKFERGFPVSSGDAYARILARHLVNGTNLENFFDTNITHGAGILFSDIAKVSTFLDHEQPFPIIVMDAISTHGNKSNILNETTALLPLTNPIYEWNPFEMGSYDPTLAAFTPSKFFGSPNNSLCVTGFDQATFVAGVSGNLFHVFNDSVESLGPSSTKTFINGLFDAIQETFPQTKIEVDASVVPNPFRNIATGTFIDAQEELLTLADGSLNGEWIPFQPLLVKARKVDTIFAIDASTDTDDNFVIGRSLIASQSRVAFFPSSYSFPPVPTTTDVFISQNLTKRPTFFGCNSYTDAPLIIYLANGGPPFGEVALTNSSMFQTSYSNEDMQMILDQTYEIATQGIHVKGARDPEWGVCLACAVVDRARSRSGIPRSGVCVSCLARYCWS